MIKRCTSFCTPLGNRWAATVAELVFRLVRSQGEQLTLGYLDIVEKRTAGKVDPFDRAKSVLAMLNARLRKHSERAAGKRVSRGGIAG